MNYAGACFVNKPHQKCRQPRQRIVASGEHPQIGPGIEVVLNRQKKAGVLSAAVAQLSAVRILFPPDPTEQSVIGGMKRDQITAAAMVWAKHQLLRRQFSESLLDVARAEPWAIPPDRDDLVVTELRDRFDRILEAFGKIVTTLSMNARTSSWRRSKKMKMDFRRKAGIQGGYAEKRPSGPRKGTPRQVDVDFVGKHKDSSTGHACGYERRRVADKPFRACSSGPSGTYSMRGCSSARR